MLGNGGDEMPPDPGEASRTSYPTAFPCDRILNRWGTTFILWSFVVTAVTGVLLFVHIRAGATETLHIWVGLLMVLAFVPHVMRNWRAFVGYLRRPATYAALAFTVLVSVALAYPVLTGGGEAGGPPGIRSMVTISSAIADAPLSAVAPIAHTDVPGLTAKLDQLGVSAAASDATIRQIATAAGKNPNDLLAQLLETQKATD